MRRRCVFAFLIANVSAVLFPWIAGAADDNAIWSQTRFAADAAALNKAASSVNVKPGTDVVVLDEEDSYVFEEGGKAVHTHYLVYKVLTQRGADGWDATSLQWEPWHEERPTLRARVITPDNAIHSLDLKTITDAPAEDEDEKTYGDGRVVKAPLPAIAPGSIVEEEQVTRETAPFFGAGVVERNYFGRGVPSQHSKLLLDAPSSLPLRYSAQLLSGVKPQKSEANGRTQVVFELGPLEPLDEGERYLPKDVPSQPVVTFSTGASWQSIAEGYARIVEDKTTVKDVQTLVNGLIAGKTTREEKAAAVVQYLSKEVRYTGVEFGDAAIVPHAPTETLKHKYGDCKDKATLAVTMLRAAGIPAYVALLNAGQRPDVDAEMPGMGLFDHAIVYVPWTPDLWIDATDEYARLGQLPQSDQGRLALIARPESTALLLIPESTSQQNHVVERREVSLAENGPARIVETSEPLGVFESEFRASYADANSNDSQKSLKSYIAKEYLSDKLGKWERSDPDDLSKQFQLVVEADSAKRGFTYLDSSVVAIRVESLFKGLPDELKEREKEPEKGTEETKEKPKKPRTADYLLPLSFTYEWQYKIVPPLGFQAKPLPPDQKILLGPATLTEEFTSESDGTVHARFIFDTVKTRLTVAEATELRNKVAQLREGAAVFVYFEPTTQALMNQGKMREAFQATRELIARHPKEAVHHLQRAKVLLAAGMGQAARDEAETAVKLEPGSALAQKTLAEILEYDLVGRQYRRGSDYAGAEAAFRAAEKLDTNDNTVVANLAILLEHNSWGLRYGPGAKLKGAIAEYRKLKPETLAELGVQNNLPFALFYAGEFADARKIAQDLNPRPAGLIVACVTAINGPQAGLAEAQSLAAGEAQLKAVEAAAGQMLENLRLYPAAADLMEAGAAGQNAAGIGAEANLLRKTELHERMSFPEDPAGVAMHSYVIQSGPDFTLEELYSLCSRNGKVTMGTPDLAERIRIERKRTVSWKSREGLFPDVGVDLSVTRAQPKIEGNDATGYKVTLWSGADYREFNYIVKENGAYKELATREQPWAIGLEALDRVAAGDTAGARALLDWLRTDLHLAGGDDPLSSSPFTRIWKKGNAASDVETKLAAAALLVETKETAARGIAVLEAGRESARDQDEKLNVTLGLLVGYLNLEEYEKAAAVCAELAKQYPESRRVFFDQSLELRILGNIEESDQLAEERLKRNSDDLDAMRALVWGATDREDYSKAHVLEQKILETGKAEPDDLNSTAWLSLFTGKIEGADIEDALKASQLSPNNASLMHTLGCVYAEVGKVKEARDVLIQAMDMSSLDEPDKNYWYAFGRIAEQYGEYDVARSDYLRVTKPEKAIDIHDSAYRLAQIRLAAMQAERAKTGR